MVKQFIVNSKTGVATIHAIKSQFLTTENNIFGTKDYVYRVSVAEENEAAFIAQLESDDDIVSYGPVHEATFEVVVRTFFEPSEYNGCQFKSISPRRLLITGHRETLRDILDTDRQVRAYRLVI